MRLLPAFAIVLASTVLGQSGLPAGKGRDSFRTSCGRCHALSAAIHQSRSREEWREVVDNMVAKGAKIKPRVADEIVEYLAKHFGQTAAH